GIANLNTLAVQKIARVKSFKIPEDGAFLAYQLEKPADTAKKSEDNGGSNTSKEGTELIFRNLATGVERSFQYVNDFSFSKDGKLLAFASTGSKKDKTAPSGVFIMDTEKGTLK